MKKMMISAASVACLLTPSLLLADGAPALMPQPAKVKVAKAKYPISKMQAVCYSGEENEKYADLLSYLLDRTVGVKLKTQDSLQAQGPVIRLLVDDKMAAQSYSITSGKKGVIVRAADKSTLAQSLSTLIQVAKGEGASAYFPELKIEDKPDMQWRSAMLDLARRWHPIESVKEFIEMMHFYKLDKLQLHLSDNESFTFGTELYPKVLMNNPDGTPRYYTKEQLRELVDFADARGIQIIPEIDIPGHSGKLWRGHPEAFGAFDDEGKPFGIGVVNMTSETTYESLEKLFEEILDVFHTSEYFHLGGDEVWLANVHKEKNYEAFCDKHDLKEAKAGKPNELYAYFLDRCDKIVRKLGRKSLLWEGFHGTGGGRIEIAKDIPIMVWNSSYNPPANLAKNGYTLINTTWEPCYFCGAMNFAPEPFEGLGWKHNRFDTWKSKTTTDEDVKVLGGQLTIWEQQYDMLYPMSEKRMAALAERWWDYKSTCSYEDFEAKFAKMKVLVDKIIRPVSMVAKGTVNKGGSRFTDAVEVKLASSDKGEIRYSLLDAWTIPAKDELVYDGKPIKLTESKIISAQLYDKAGKKIGYPQQKVFEKIDPVLEYEVYKEPPLHGWPAMPDFGELKLVKKGLFGRINPMRHSMIQRGVFYGIEKLGHIDTRPFGIYNPIALKLKGKVKIAESGSYQFVLVNQDGMAEIKIGKNEFKGLKKSNVKQDFSFELKKGEYPLEIKYYYEDIQNVLNIKFKSPGSDKLQGLEDLMISLD